jgi:hypothetical protein
VLTIFSIMLGLSACGAPRPQIAPSQQVTPEPRATSTLQPTPTDIPGFKGWSILNSGYADVSTDAGALVLTLKSRALWFMNQRGVLVYTPATAGFRLSAKVHVSKSSDPAQAPGGDGTVQLAGLMVRDGNASRGENYAFIAVGDDGDGLSVETKNTVNSVSKYEGPNWDADTAELRVCRFGATVSLYKRHADSGEAWSLARTYERGDLPEKIQAGMIIYTDSAPDVRARFEAVNLEPVTSAAECGE